MGFFDSIQKPGFKAAKGKYSHIEQQISKVAPPPRPSIPLSQRVNNRQLPRKSAPPQNPSSANSSPRSQGSNRRKRTAVATPQPLESDSEDGAADQSHEGGKKRIRRASDIEPDLNRQIRNDKAFSKEDCKEFSMVHAADIASTSKPTKFTIAFPDYPQATHIYLQYPSNSQREKYELVVPIQSDDFKALEDIREVMETIMNNYVPSLAADMMRNDSTGLIRRLKRVVERRAGNEYIDHIQEWNDTLAEFTENGTIAKAIDQWNHIDLKLLERILTQTYSRTVSPRVHMLRRYENGTDNVYGELLPKFLSLILKKDVKMKSDQVFVDLGSGVGNCVLQAALEVGCESWGCEMMENACDLAELQEKEFNARCRLWGLSVGQIRLERGDFLENDTILKVLQKADVILVNNQAFTPSLNENLTNLFLDLKEGAKIISLKSFVPHGHKMSHKNLSAACNNLSVVEKTYYSSCVSWTDAPGTYYVSTKDSARVEAFAKKNL